MGGLGQAVGPLRLSSVGPGVSVKVLFRCNGVTSADLCGEGGPRPIRLCALKRKRTAVPQEEGVPCAGFGFWPQPQCSLLPAPLQVSDVPPHSRVSRWLNLHLSPSPVPLPLSLENPNHHPCPCLCPSGQGPRRVVGGVPRACWEPGPLTAPQAQGLPGVGAGLRGCRTPVGVSLWPVGLVLPFLFAGAQVHFAGLCGVLSPALLDGCGEQRPGPGIRCSGSCFPSCGGAGGDGRARV